MGGLFFGRWEWVGNASASGVQCAFIMQDVRDICLPVGRTRVKMRLCVGGFGIQVVGIVPRGQLFCRRMGVSPFVRC